MKRREFVMRGAAVLAAPWVLAKAAAEDFPIRPIKVVVPGAAGAVLDVNARRVAELMSRQIGQQVIVENRPGANGVIAVDAVLRSKPDGYTILVGGSSTVAVLPYAMDKPPYDPRKDLIPLTLGVNGSPIVIINPQLPVRTLKELFDYAKAHPGELTSGTAGVATPNYLAIRLLERVAGIKVSNVVYKNQPEIMTDLIAGQLQVTIDFASIAAPHLQAGKLRGLAVMGSKRKPALPDIPTAGEAGYPELTMMAWHGYFAPGGTPPEVADKLSLAIAAAIRRPEYAEFVKGLGGDLGGNSRQEFKAFVESETQRWSKIVRELGVKIEM